MKAVRVLLIVALIAFNISVNKFVEVTLIPDAFANVRLSIFKFVPVAFAKFKFVELKLVPVAFINTKLSVDVEKDSIPITVPFIVRDPFIVVVARVVIPVTAKLFDIVELATVSSFKFVDPEIFKLIPEIAARFDVLDTVRLVSARLVPVALV